MSDTFMLLVDEFAKLSREQKAFKAEAEALTPKLEELRARLIEAHPHSGLGKSFKLASGGQVVFAEHTKTVTVDKLRLVEWFLANKMQAMLGVNSRTLTSFCREEMKENRPLPDGVEVGSYTLVTFKKK